MEAILRILEDEGYTFQIAQDKKLVIGSNPKADIVIEDKISVARKHAILELSRGNLFITCFEKNSTFINGSVIRHLQRVRLHENDLICLSKSGPELLVEEITSGKRAENEKKKKKSAYLKKGCYLLMILFSFLAFISLYMDANFNLKLIATEDNPPFNFFLFFSSWGKKADNKNESNQSSQSLSITDKETIGELNNQLKTILIEKVSKVEIPELQSMIFKPAMLADSVFLLISVDRTNHILTVGTVFSIRESGLLCTALPLIKGAERIFIKYKEYYALAHLIYEDKGLGVAFLRTPLMTKPLNIRILNKNDVGISVYALGHGGADYIINKGILNGLIQDLNYLITDAARDAISLGGPLFDAKGFVIGMNAPSLKEVSEQHGQSAVNIKIVTDFEDYNDTD
jgi:S1-C subfamily serine protease